MPGVQFSFYSRFHKIISTTLACRDDRGAGPVDTHTLARPATAPAGGRPRGLILSMAEQHGKVRVSSDEAISPDFAEYIYSDVFDLEQLCAGAFLSITINGKPCKVTFNTEAPMIESGFSTVLFGMVGDNYVALKMALYSNLEAREHLLNEAVVMKMSSEKGIPHVAEILAGPFFVNLGQRSRSDGGINYVGLLMPRHGQSLDRLLPLNPPIVTSLSDRLSLVVTVLRQSMHALIAMHNNNFVHRDIKPHNILLDDAHCVRICDFGLSSIPGHAKRGASSARDYRSPSVARREEEVQSDLIAQLTGMMLMGTGEGDKAGFLADGSSTEINPPEAGKSSVYEWHDDLFSLGLVIYQMLMGKKLITTLNSMDYCRQVRKSNIYIVVLEDLNPEMDSEERKALIKDKCDAFVAHVLETMTSACSSEISNEGKGLLLNLAEYIHKLLHASAFPDLHQDLSFFGSDESASPVGMTIPGPAGDVRFRLDETDIHTDIGTNKEASGPACNVPPCGGKADVIATIRF